MLDGSQLFHKFATITFGVSQDEEAGSRAFKMVADPLHGLGARTGGEEEGRVRDEDGLEVSR